MSLRCPVGVATTRWPYSNKWQFTAERGRRLRVHAGPFNVTLMMEMYNISAAEQMDDVRTNVTSDKNPIPPDTVELIKVNGEPVLRTEINAEKIHKLSRDMK